MKELEALARWLVSLDHPDPTERARVSLQEIVQRARSALAATPAKQIVVTEQWFRIISHHVEAYGWRLVDISVVLESEDLPTFAIWPKEENERATAPDPE